MGFARFYLYRTKYVNLYARMAGGVGFATRYFNYLTNPENNIIGSMANIAVQFRLGVEWKINPYCQLNTAFTFSHFSNGASQMPNYGMNLPSGTIGIKVFPQPKEFSYNCSKNKVLKRHEINVQYHFGLQEYGGFNGPKFPVHGGSIFYAYYTSFANKIYAGFAMEYYPLLRSAALSQEFVLKEGNTWGAIYPSVILGDEIMLGRASMYYQLGLYTPKRERAPNWLYFRLGGHIYFAQLGKHKQYKIFGGTNVKAHLSVANYWGFNAGASAAF